MHTAYTSTRKGAEAVRTVLERGYVDGIASKSEACVSCLLPHGRSIYENVENSYILYPNSCCIRTLQNYFYSYSFGTERFAHL